MDEDIKRFVKNEVKRALEPPEEKSKRSAFYIPWPARGMFYLTGAVLVFYAIFFVAAIVVSHAQFFLNLLLISFAILVIYVGVKLFLPFYRGPMQTSRLYREVLHARNNSMPTVSNILRDLQPSILLPVFEQVVAEIFSTLELQDVPPPRAGFFDWPAHEAERERLRLMHKRFGPHDILTQRLKRVFGAVYESITRALPNALAEPELGTIAFTDAADVKGLITIISGHFFSEDAKGLFDDLRKTLNLNRYIVSEGQLGDRVVKSNPGARVEARDFKGSPARAVQAYLKNTPLVALFDLRLPYAISLENPETRFNHTHIAGDSGKGKTQALLRSVLIDLKRQPRPGMVIIDPHGEMFETVAHNQMFANNEDLVIIHPDDDPALNLFDANLEKIIGAPRKQQERVYRSVLTMSEYFFEALNEGSEFSDKMRGVYMHLAELMMMYRPVRGTGATADTLQAVMRDISQFDDVVASLSASSQAFFRDEFADKKQHTQTKEGISWRLRALTREPAFKRMFGAPANLLDIPAALDTGKVILVTSGDLSREHTRVLGRYFIARTLQAALSRPEGYRHPAFLYVDEAQLFFDQKTEQIFDEARKFRLGMTLAHQRLSHASPSLRDALGTVAVRMGAGAVNGGMAPGMTPEFLESMKLTPRLKAEWALYDRDCYPQAVKLTIPLGAFDHEPRMSAAAYDTMRARNRARFTVTPPPGAPPPPPPGASSADINTDPGDF